MSPEQNGFDPLVRAIVTAGDTGAETVIVILLDVTAVDVTHNSLDVKTHVTVCALDNVVVENVGLLVPAFIPFTFH